MAINNSSGTEAVTESAASAATPAKKKSSRSSKTGAGTAASRPTAKRSAARSSEEILFKDLPNPFKPAAPPYIWIDHPQQNERLLGPKYAVRLGVGGAEAVEMSIDKGAWQPCRATSGYWWYDWAGISRGKHVLVARMRTSSGLWYKTPPRTIEY